MITFLLQILGEKVNNVLLHRKRSSDKVTRIVLREDSRKIVKHQNKVHEIWQYLLFIEVDQKRSKASE